MSGSPPAAPSLTVVVPTYGRAGDLSALLERLVPQLGERKSLVIVNDGSPSPAYDRVIAAHASPHLRYLVLPRNIGRGGARNAGAAACDTGWIVFTDDDCRPPPGWLDRIASLVARHDGGPAALDLIGGRTYPVLDHPPGFLSRVLACAGYHPNPVTVQGDLHCAVTAACAVRASALAAVGGFDPAYTTGEDLNLTARLTRAGYRARIARDWWTGHTVDASLPETCGRFFRYGRAAAQNAFALSDWSAHYFRTSMTLPAILRTIRRGMARRHARFARARFPMAERLAATAITGVVESALHLGWRRGLAEARRAGRPPPPPEVAAGRWTPLSDGVRLEIRLGTAPPLEVEALGLHSGDLLRLEATPRGGGPPTVHELTVEQLLARRQGKDVRLRLPTPAGEGPFEVRLVHLSAPARPAPG